MKIWFIECGGEPTPIDKENARLRRMGLLAYTASDRENIEVHWITGSFNHVAKNQREISDNPIMLRKNLFLHIEKNGSYKKNVSAKRVVSYMQLAMSIRKRMEELAQPDLVFTALAPIEISSVVSNYAVHNHIPYIIDIRDMWPESFYDVVPDRFRHFIDPYVRYCKGKLKNSLKNSSALIGLNEDFLNYGLKYACRERKDIDAVFPLSYPSWDNAQYKNKLGNYWGKNEITEKDFIVLFLGFFGKQQAFDSVFEAARALIHFEDIKFVLCGEGEYLETYRENSPPNCIFPGYVDKEKLRTLLANSKIGLLPVRDYPGFRMNTPNKFAEYLSAGLPILVSVSGTMENYLNSYQCGFKYQDANHLKELIEHLYSYPEEYCTASDNARRLYNEKFNSDTEYQKMIDYIIQISDH